jgi:rod shape determining protein RodA
MPRRLMTRLNLQPSAGFEWPLVALSLILTCIGLFLIMSATSPMGGAGRAFVLRQITWLCLGLIAGGALLLFDYKLIGKWAFWFYVIIVILLIAVWGLGKVTAGSRRWIELGLMRFQPSEFSKLALVLVLAVMFQEKAGTGKLDFSDLLKPFVLILVPVVLVLIQPDLGTAGVIVLVGISMIAFVGISARVMKSLCIMLAVSAPVLFFLSGRILMDYQLRRLYTFFSPANDPQGSGYHIIQSQIAIGSGGVMGKGFMQGTQNQLMFLPVKHTDFIFSILGEEFGFIGCLVVLVLYCMLLMRGITVVGKARDSFGALLAFGCVSIFFWHILINTAMVMGLFPVVGVPLSFMSYGGSSLLSSFLMVSILVNVSVRRFSY